jgi:hypothetical protein
VRTGKIPGSRVAEALLPLNVIGLGQDRAGPDLAIAVSPQNSRVVYVAWGDRQGSVYTLHLRASTDGGLTWPGPEIKTIPDAKNPAVAVNTDGTVAFMYQQVEAGHWKTIVRLLSPAQKAGGLLDIRPNGRLAITEMAPQTLSSWPLNSLNPITPFLGDYAQIASVGRDFYGAFSASNDPDPANFPSGREPYSRAISPTNPHQLAGIAGQNVDSSLDPFFFSITFPESAPRLRPTQPPQ